MSEPTRPSILRRLRQAVPLRWRLLILVAVAVIAALLWIWVFSDDMRQQKVVRTIMVSFLGVVLLLVWVALLSKLRWYLRVAVLLGVPLAAFATSRLVRWEGVSGDLVPILAWRWSPDHDRAFDERPPADINSAPRTLPGAADYPQFLGPQRNASFAPVRLARDWAQSPPREVWRRAVGAGWSAFAIDGARAVTQEQRGDQEMVVCYELATGDIVWSHGYRARYEDRVAGVGPRATPTIAGERVYTVGATGILTCLELITGRPLWSIDVLEDNAADRLDWGISGSPLVVAELVVVNPGGSAGRSLVAYDRSTGRRVWSGGDDRASYASPAIRELAGVPQLLMVNRTSVTGHDPGTGRVLWEHPWPGETPKVAQPVPIEGDRLFITCGYGIGSTVLQITAVGGSLRAEVMWKNRRMKAKFSNVVHRDGLVYGLDDGILACVEVTGGRRLWKGGRYGHGQLILVDDLLLIQAESGEVVLVEAVPDVHRELARFTALSDKTWNCPALAGRYLLVRNDREAACFELPEHRDGKP